MKIRKVIKDEVKASVAITLDGPLGPFHEPKMFPFAISLFAKRRVVPLSINTQKKISLNNRWDKFIIPLPFNKINVYVHDPIEVIKEDLKNEFVQPRKNVKEIMEKWEKINKPLRKVTSYEKIN